MDTLLKNWIKAFVIGIFVWFGLTVIYGFIVGILDLDNSEFYSSNSFLHNFILYPLGIWIGFKITKTPFFGADKKIVDEKVFKKQMDKILEEEEAEYSKVKSNKSKSPIENFVSKFDFAINKAWEFFIKKL